MQVRLGDNEISLKDGSFVSVPVQWLFDERLIPTDLHKLIKLWWRYDYFCYLALQKDKDADLTKVFFPSQEALCELFGMSKKSQPKISEFLKRMEEYGYIQRIKSGFVDQSGHAKPRHYIVVNRGDLK
ncbi:TPA: hypothetical protein MA058_003525 [Klebsiella pneumoniae]|nr:hypothetical protein [Klebsiella pneumoniae]